MQTSQEKEKCIDVDNFMIELDIEEQSQNLNQIRKKKKTKSKQQDKWKKLDRKYENNKQIKKQRLSSLQLLNTYEIKKKIKRKVIVIDEKDSPKMKKKKQNSIIQNCQEAKDLIGMTELIQQISNEQQELKNDEIKFQRKKSIPTLITDASIQTDEIIDVKKLEVFHLLKLTQNFILSMHNVTDKALRIYNS